MSKFTQSKLSSGQPNIYSSTITSTTSSTSSSTTSSNLVSALNVETNVIVNNDINEEAIEETSSKLTAIKKLSALPRRFVEEAFFHASLEKKWILEHQTDLDCTFSTRATKDAKKGDYKCFKYCYTHPSTNEKEKLFLVCHQVVALLNWQEEHGEFSIWPDGYQCSHDCHHPPCVKKPHINAVPSDENQSKSNWNCFDKVVCRLCGYEMQFCEHTSKCFGVKYKTCVECITKVTC